MTELGVGRLRTAFPLPSAPPVGDSTPMPPHIQGAERQMERRVRRTRWGLRVLVLSALAGAAWLLTGAAAQAADRTDGPTGSLLGSVAGEGDASPLSGPPTAPTQSAESEHDFAAPVLEVPRVLTRPAATLSAAPHQHTRTPVDAALGSVDHYLGEVARP